MDSDTMSIEIEYSNSLRLCHIYKWECFDGYGFNLHAEKGKPGQYIGKVDQGSPAEAAGLKEGDRIIEVNGVNISNENHKQVVQRIKASPDETKLLVVDPEGENYFRSKNIVLKSSLPYVVQLTTPASPTNFNTTDQSSTEDAESQKSVKSIQSSENETMSSVQTCVVASDNTSNDNNLNYNNKQNALNLNMTAKELRAQLAARKKYDPKKDHSIDFKKKYDIVQKL